MSFRAFLLACVIALLPSLADAQGRAQTRDGFWFNGGVGYGTIGCDGCNNRNNSLTLSLGAGGAMSRKVLFGASFDAAIQSRGGATLTVATLLARLRFYPSLTNGFFLTGGLGLGKVSADATEIGTRANTGTAALIGMGYDIRVGTNASLTPFWNGFSTGALDTNYNVGQLGVSLTIH